MPFKDQEKLKQYQHQYHEDHKQEINQNNRERRQTDECKEKHKQYRLANKDRLDAKNKEKFECGCGGCYTRPSKSTHEKSKIHIEWMSTQPQSNQ